MTDCAIQQTQFIQRGIAWWNRGQESYVYSCGAWLHYATSIADGQMVGSFASLPDEIKPVAIANYQRCSTWRDYPAEREFWQ